MALCIVHRVWQWAGFEVGSFLLFPSPRIGTFTYSLIPFIYQSLLLKKKKWLDSCIKKTVTNEETEGVSVPKTLPEVNAVWTGAWVDFRKGVVGGKKALLRRAILCKMGWRPGLKGDARTGTIASWRLRGESRRKKGESLEQLACAMPHPTLISSGALTALPQERKVKMSSQPSLPLKAEWAFPSLSCLHHGSCPFNPVCFSVFPLQVLLQKISKTASEATWAWSLGIL